jgi:hypothetical protein
MLPSWLLVCLLLAVCLHHSLIHSCTSDALFVVSNQLQAGRAVSLHHSDRPSGCCCCCSCCLVCRDNLVLDFQVGAAAHVFVLLGPCLYLVTEHSLCYTYLSAVSACSFGKSPTFTSTLGGARPGIQLPCQCALPLLAAP